MTAKTRIITHAYADNERYTTQDLNAREIALQLSPEKYEVTMFYFSTPDPRLIEAPHIKLINVRPLFGISSFYIVSKLLGDYDLFFYFRCFNTDKKYLKFRKLLGDKKPIFYIVETRVTMDEYERIRYGLDSSDYKYSVSKEVSESVKTHFGLDTKVVYAGVDTKKFKPIPLKKTGRQNILFVGTLNERKRPYLMLEAAKWFPKIDFHLIGTGPLEAKLHAFATNNVFLHGRVSLDALVNFMQYADLFILPSLEEGLGKVTIEAQATGTPVIIFDTYGSESMIDGKTGFAVKTFEEMLDKIELLMENKELRFKMGTEARKFSKKFDWSNIAKQWEMEFDISAEISKGVKDE